MTGFVAISSLAIVFYVVMLVALSRDLHRERTGRVEMLTPLRVAPPTGEGRTASIREDEVAMEVPDEMVWVPVTKFEWRPGQRPGIDRAGMHDEAEVLAISRNSRPERKEFHA